MLPAPLADFDGIAPTVQQRHLARIFGGDFTDDGDGAACCFFDALDGLLAGGKEQLIVLSPIQTDGYPVRNPQSVLTELPEKSRNPLKKPVLPGNRFYSKRKVSPPVGNR